MVHGTGLLGGAMATWISVLPYVTLFLSGKLRLFVDFITHIQLHCPTA